MRSTRLQLCAPSKNTLKRRTLPFFGAASNIAVALASRTRICARNVEVEGAHAEDEVETVGAAEVDRLRRGNNGCRHAAGFRSWANGCEWRAPGGAARPWISLPAGPSGGTQNGGDEAAGAVEDDDRLKAVFVIVRIEQPQLLAAVDGVEHVVDVEGDALAGRPAVNDSQ